MQAEQDLQEDREKKNSVDISALLLESQFLIEEEVSPPSEF